MESKQRTERSAVIYEGTPGVRLETPDLVVLGTDASQLRTAATRASGAGWTRIELCGGVDIETAAEVRRVLPKPVRVGLNRYGFESLERIAEYKTAFARGEVRPAVFLVPAASGAERVEHSDVTIIPVTTPDHAATLAARLAEDDVGLVELYGGLGTAHAAAIVRGANGRIPVGFVGYDD